MEKQILKSKVESIISQKVGHKADVLVPIPVSKRFDIREYTEGKEKTAVTAFGKDDNQCGIYTKTNFIPLDELSYRELEKTLNVVSPDIPF